MKNKIIVSLFIAISLSSCVSEDANYKIITEQSAYYTKKYRKEGNCIYFNDLSCGCEDGGQEIMVCGNYTIRSIRGEK